MNRRSFLNILARWLAGLFIFLGLGGLAYRLIGEGGLSSTRDAGGAQVLVDNDRDGFREANTDYDETDKVSMPKRMLGKTGYEVSLFSLGGEATIEQTARADEAEEIINRAIDLGVNYIDTAPAYGGGGSESNIGRVMSYRREEIFLATKTPDRSYDGTMRQLEKSLERLSSDYLDLYQLHNMRTADDLERAFAANGAIEALQQLKEEGVIRFTGITGHKDPDLLLEAIGRFPFDCLLFSFNAGDIHYNSFREKLLPEAVRLNMGVIAMKVTAVGRIFSSGALSTMKQAMDYVLTHPVSTAIVGISTLAEIEENVRLAAQFRPLTLEELRELEALAEPYADEANFFKHHW